ncbi:MAG: hypothetical protein KAT15_06895, partial [Bacteroidales bacterium]|nr:hypothetical protein [Bacteroidales bacterium]
HFGDADKYQIYNLSNEEFKLLYEEENPFKSMDETSGHGTEKKADGIINFLCQKNVSVIVSRKFGVNIKHIVNHFIPVEVNEETPDKVQTILLKHMRWLQEELNKHPDHYKLFVINKGILKLAVQKHNQ